MRGPPAKATTVQAPAVFAAAGWKGAALSRQGTSRTENQDQWSLAVAGDGRVPPAVAVFDGVGGLPGGGAASLAAAAALPGLVAQGLVGDALLQRLNAEVRATRGASTCVVLSLANPVRLVSVGDSSAYALDERGRPGRLTPSDAGLGGVILDCLGLEAMRGHIATASRHHRRFLLCTDGVDGVVTASDLARALRDEVEPAAALVELFARLEDAGMPDDATAVLVARP